MPVRKSNDDNRRTGLSSSDAAICSRSKSKVRPNGLARHPKNIRICLFPAAYIAHPGIIVQILAQEQIAVLPQPLIMERKAITVGTTERFIPQFSDKLYFLEPVKIGIHIKFLHSLFLFRCPFPCLLTQIPQCFSQLIIFGQPQNIVIQLQGVKHPKINADGLLLVRLSPYVTRLVENRLPVPLLEPCSDSCAAEPTLSALPPPASSAPISVATWCPLYF